MHGLRLAVLTLIGITASLCGSEPAQAQFYGGGAGYGSGIGYGGGGYGGIGYGGGYGYGGGGYGGMGYGPGGYGGGGYGAGNYYSGGNVSGAYPSNNWYVSPYRTLSPGFVSPYGNGFGATTNYGTRGYATGYGLPVYNPVVAPNAAVYVPQIQPLQGSPYLRSDATGGTPIPRSSVPNSSIATNSLPLQRPAQPVGNIKLTCPKTAAGSLTYTLNGQAYSIQPGYSQNFRDDRAWTLEFKRGGDASEVVRYSLKAGTYKFSSGVTGWELVQSAASASDLPPEPALDLSPTTSPSPTPLPPQ